MTERPVILIVEDSATQAVRLEAELDGAGFSVIHAASAEAALDRLRSQRPDLVITDFYLPGMSGADLCRRMKDDPRTETIPILMLTRSEDPEIEQRVLEFGADDHVRKSDGKHVMVARVEALLRGARRGPSGAAWSLSMRQPTVLVIDDSPTTQALIRALLEREGCKVVCASGGHEALNIVRQRLDDLSTGDDLGLDCIVIDLVMPELDGIGVLKSLEALRASSDVSFPMLMLTSESSSLEMKTALDAGADDFVFNRKNDAILISRIRVLLRRKFRQDQQRAVHAEFRKKEAELVRAEAQAEEAEARAALVEQLQAANAELKQTQMQLYHSAAIATLGELTAGIAHEINNPLSYAMSHVRRVITWLGAVSEEEGENLPDAARESVEKSISRAGAALDGLERVADLVVKLRTFSRLDEGEFKTADIHECIESALPIVNWRLREVSLHTDFAADGVVFCAPSLVSRMILNLLTNALDAIEDVGEIWISTHRTGKAFTIAVADSGPGIPDEYRDRIFEPFFTTKAIGQGTGLGLSIGAKIAHSHGGALEVRNRDGGGTVILFSISTNLEQEMMDVRESA